MGWPLVVVLPGQSFFNVATDMDETGHLHARGGRSLRALSHGESFMAVLLNKSTPRA